MKTYVAVGVVCCLIGLLIGSRGSSADPKASARAGKRSVSGGMTDEEFIKIMKSPPADATLTPAEKATAMKYFHQRMVHSLAGLKEESVITEEERVRFGQMGTFLETTEGAMCTGTSRCGKCQICLSMFMDNRNLPPLFGMCVRQPGCS